MNKRIAPIFFTAFLIAAVLCAFLWRSVGRMEEENKALRAEIQALGDEAQARAPAAERDRARATELESQQSELLRLRNEVSQLRANRDTVRHTERGPSENRAPVDGSQTPAYGQNIPIGDWKFGGYETPQAALMSGFWAMKEGQLAQLLNSLTPDERDRFENQAQGKSDSEIAQKFQKDYGKVTGLRALAEHELDTGKILLDVYLEGTGKLKKFTMEQINGEWKAASPIDQMVVPAATPDSGNAMAYYMQNPELMKRYFPQLYATMEKQRQQEAGQATAPAAK